VVVLTHALDELHLEAISTSPRRLKTPHLVLLAFLRNVPLEERMLLLPATDLDAFQIAAAAEFVSLQRDSLRQVQQTGLLVIDCLPQQLSSQLISRYLDIKARHLL
jgi:uncharacterized protein (DUF58 family)